MKDAQAIIQQQHAVLTSEELVSVCHIAQIHHARYQGPVFNSDLAKAYLEGK